jgi:Cu/Zn superoxide dismutase
MSRTFSLVALLAISSLPLSATAARAADNSGGKVFALDAQNGSGEHGTVALKPRGSKTVIEIHLVGAPASPQPAHIHLGTCDKLDPTPKYPLTSLVNGISETTVDQPIAALTAGGMAVNVHKSADDLKDYVACGNL